MKLGPFTLMLRHLFHSNVSGGNEAVAATAARLEERVLALVGNLPTLPSVALQAIALADDPDVSFARFADLIEGDPSIASSLLRIANSPFYASGAPATRLEQALMRMGLFPCKNLVIAIGTRSRFHRIPANVAQACQGLWHHGSVTASICRALNRVTRLGFNGEEYSAGLLHDLGRVLLLLADRECCDRAQVLDYHEGDDVLERERTAIGIDHANLGACFAEHSQLPACLIAVMRYHHQPEAATDWERLVALVATADHIANHVQLSGPATTYQPEANRGLQCLGTGWSAARKDRLLDAIHEMLARYDQGDPEGAAE